MRHTISYNETAYKHFYLFDITEMDDEEDENIYEVKKVQDYVIGVAEHYDIRHPQYHGAFQDVSMDKLTELAGYTEIGKIGEGVVIKNYDFINKWGGVMYAKLVTESFKEDNNVTFGGNNKHSESYWEMYITNKYITLGRVQKIMHKIQPLIDERLDMKHIPRITHTVYMDMLSEEILEIQKKVKTIDFYKLKRVVMLKTKQIYIDILNGDISIANKKDE